MTTDIPPEQFHKIRQMLQELTNPMISELFTTGYRSIGPRFQEGEPRKRKIDYLDSDDDEDSSWDPEDSEWEQIPPDLLLEWEQKAKEQSEADLVDHQQTSCTSTTQASSTCSSCASATTTSTTTTTTTTTTSTNTTTTTSTTMTFDASTPATFLSAPSVA